MFVRGSDFSVFLGNSAYRCADEELLEPGFVVAVLGGPLRFGRGRGGRSIFHGAPDGLDLRGVVDVGEGHECKTAVRARARAAERERRYICIPVTQELRLLLQSNSKPNDAHGPG